MLQLVYITDKYGGSYLKFGVNNRGGIFEIGDKHKFIKTEVKSNPQSLTDMLQDALKSDRAGSKANYFQFYFGDPIINGSIFYQPSLECPFTLTFTGGGFNFTLNMVGTEVRKLQDNLNGFYTD